MCVCIYVYCIYIYIWISSRTHMYTPHAEGCAEGSQSQGQGEGEGQESHLGCLRSYSSLSCRFSVRVLGQFPCYPGIGEVQRPIARWTRLFVDTCRHVLWGAMVGNVCCARSLWDQSRFQWKMDDVCCVAVGWCLVWLQSSSWQAPQARVVPVALWKLWLAGEFPICRWFSYLTPPFSEGIFQGVVPGGWGGGRIRFWSFVSIRMRGDARCSTRLGAQSIMGGDIMLYDLPSFWVR